MANGAPLDTSLGITNPYPNPFLEINTGDKNLNNVSTAVAFTCTSTLSKMGPGSGPSSETTQVNIDYVDECYQTYIYEPTVQSVQIPLYWTAAVSYTVPMSTLSCGPVTTNIISISPDDGNTPVITVDDDNGVLVLMPDQLPQIDVPYTVVLQSCIDVQNAPLSDPSDVTAVCSDPSEPFDIDVVDPCASTEILSGMFSNVMAAPQLRTDALVIPDVMPAGTWPWMSKTDYDLGYNVCGTVTYSVLIVDPSSPTGYSSTDLVVQSVTGTGEPMLVLQPSLDYTPGNYNLILVGTLPNGISVSQPFTVTVLDCVVDTLSWMDGVEINPFTNIWYSAPASYDISVVRDYIVQ